MASSKLKNLFALILLIYTASPVIFKYSIFIQRSLLFMNYVNTNNNNLSNPEEIGFKCTRLLRLNYKLPLTNTGNNAGQLIEIGAWHILPQSSVPLCETDTLNNRTSIDDKLAFNDQRPIVLYVHGNGGNRAGNHRNGLYKRLAYEHDFHILTFDYRGYGDSTNETPTAFGISTDALEVYKWLLKQPNVNKDRIIVWGHSLGTAVAVRMVADLALDASPKRLVLEAPFDSVANAVANHPFSTPFRVLPYFEYFFIDPIEKSNELNFDSASRIGDIKSTPIMILHAEDDPIIPEKLGLKLYQRAAKELGNGKVKFLSISASHGLGHKNIYKHDQAISSVAHFITANDINLVH